MAEALNEAAARSPHPHRRRLPSPAERRGCRAATRIQTIGMQRLRRRLDRLSTEHAARLRRIITEMYGE